MHEQAAGFAMDKGRRKLERLLNAYERALSEDKLHKSDDNHNKFVNSEEKITMNRDIEEYRGEISDEQTEDNSISCSLQHVLFGAFCFLSGAAMNLICPYLSVYYGQLGMNPQQIGIIQSVQSWVAIPWTPLNGYLSGKYGLRKVLIIGSLLGTAGIYLGLYFVPEVRYGDCAVLEIPEECTTGKAGVEQAIEETTTTTFTQNVETNLRTDVSSNIGSNLTVECIYRLEISYIEHWFDENDRHRLFIYLILINIACQILGAAWFPLADGVILEQLGNESRNQYGYFKAFGAFSHVLA